MPHRRSFNSVNADPSVQEVVYVGDIHSGSEASTQHYDQEVFNRYSLPAVPEFVSYGDGSLWASLYDASEVYRVDRRADRSER